jgi:hypothetical protein
MNDSYLLDAGWLFFAAWSIIVIVVSLTAFRSDLFPAQARLDPAREAPPDPSRPEESGAR